MTIPTVTGDRLAVHFDRFDPESYQLFLRVKRLPEYTVEFHEQDETYTVSAPARFATLLGVQPVQADRGDLPLPDFLFDDQREIVQMALDAKRFAVWSDCGLGKTLVQLEWARQVQHRTGGRVLLITMNEIVQQTIEEAAWFYGDGLPVERLRSRLTMRDWCKNGAPGLAITNYEKMNPESLSDQIVSEMKHLTGIVLDESSRLKTGGGKQKWALIKSCKGIEYKLSCTATPAPNDTMEFASQASFLEKMRSEGEIIWTYFRRDEKTHRWTVKRHARAAFFEFMAGWSIYVRDPRRYGWRRNMVEVPEPVIQIHEIAPTAEQLTWLRKLSTEVNGQQRLFHDRDTNAIQRAKLSQIAKGFIYNRDPNGRISKVNSLKPSFVAELVKREVADGLQVLVWTVFDAESDRIAVELCGDVAFDLLTGKVAPSDRGRMLERFRTGKSRVLISRASMLGYGMNLQHCGAMIFSGWNDSYESYYQAVRRAYRYGQTRQLRVHLPVIRELEGDMLDNIQRKQTDHEAAIAEMEANYILARRILEGSHVA